VAFPPKEEYISLSPEETALIGEKIGSTLKKGDIVALEGTLGAGKTVLARGMAHSLGVTEEITSPSYAIICEYESGKVPFYHIDAYRLRGNDDFCLAGGEEALYGEGICVVEWPERICLPSSAINVRIKIEEDGKRVICREAAL
jgi:tRNA threonylcarbamoyladenosine biosynthesis protein TsaE